MLRKARKEDLDQLIGLLQLLFTIEEDFNFDALKQQRGLQLMLENRLGCVLVAEEAGKVVGMCTGQLVISTAEGGPSVLVEDMVIDPVFQGCGLGRTLLEAMLQWAEQQGATRLQLLADKNNQSALDFYEHLGWRSTSLICLRNILQPEQTENLATPERL